MTLPWQKTSHGIELFVKLTPNASKNSILGILKEANDKSFLKISVTAIPENNKANQALIAFLSKILHIPKSYIFIKSGLTFNRKIVAIEGIGEEDLEKL